MTRLIAAFFLAALTSFPAAAAHRAPGAAPEITAASINASAPSGRNDNDPSLIAKAEVLLDRDHFSPGEIDGMNGDNYRRALRTFQQANTLPATGILDADTWNALIANALGPVLKSYTITDADLAGRHCHTNRFYWSLLLPAPVTELTIPIAWRFGPRRRDCLYFLDVTNCILRSRRRVGWCEFSARLFLRRPWSWRADNPISDFAAP